MSRRPAGSNRRSQRGISLVETLVAMVLGLLVLGAVLQLTNRLVAANTATIQLARLEQDTRTVMDIIIQDVRRAGQFPEASGDLGQIQTFLKDQPAAWLIDGEPIQSGKPGSTLAYQYREADGKLVQARFSLDAKSGSVQMHTGSASAAETITDSAFMTVTELRFVPHLVVSHAGTLQTSQLLLEVHLGTHLKSDAATVRELTDRAVLRNPHLASKQ